MCFLWIQVVSDKRTAWRLNDPLDRVEIYQVDEEHLLDRNINYSFPQLEVPDSDPPKF